MPRSIHRLVLALAAAAAFFALGAATRNQDQDKAPDPALVKRFMEAMQPGPEHAMLAKLAGTWSQTIKMWMAPGQKEPVVSRSTATSKMILGGRFLETRSKGEMAMPGMPAQNIEHLGIMGFDRRSGEFTQVGFDNMGTYGVAAKGSYDAKTKTLTLQGEDHDAVFGFTQKYDFVWRLTGEDEYVFEVIFKDRVHAPDGKPFKMVEITAKRAR